MLLLSFALECCADFPGPLVVAVLCVPAVRPSGDRLQSLGLRDEAMHFFFDGGDEMFAVGGFEGVGGLDLFCVSDVVFRVEKGIDCVGTHYVSVGLE